MEKHLVNSKGFPDINKLEEKFFLDSYLSCNQNIIHIGCPIESIAQKNISSGCGIPDAIIGRIGKNDTPSFIEVTTFSRCEEMRKDISMQRIRPEKFDYGKLRSLNLDLNLLVNEFDKAINKKFDKNYGEFTVLEKLQSKGTLLVAFVNSDPFFDENAYECFLILIRNYKSINVRRLANSCFHEIIFGAWVPVGNHWQVRWETL